MYQFYLSINFTESLRLSSLTIYNIRSMIKMFVIKCTPQFYFFPQFYFIHHFYLAISLHNFSSFLWENLFYLFCPYFVLILYFCFHFDKRCDHLWCVELWKFSFVSLICFLFFVLICGEIFSPTECLCRHLTFYISTSFKCDILLYM